MEIDKGIARAISIGTKGRDDDGKSGIVPTYFGYEVSKWSNFEVIYHRVNYKIRAVDR